MTMHGRYELAAPSFLGAQAVGGDCDRPGPAGVQGHRLTLALIPALTLTLTTLTLILTMAIPTIHKVQGH